MAAPDGFEKRLRYTDLPHPRAAAARSGRSGAGRPGGARRTLLSRFDAAAGAAPRAAVAIMKTGTATAPAETPRRVDSPRSKIMTESNEQARSKIVDEFSAVLTEAEDMLKRAANETGEKAKDLRSQVEAKLLTREAAPAGAAGPGGGPRQGDGARDRRLRARPSVAGDRHRRGGRRRGRPADEPPLSAAASVTDGTTGSAPAGGLRQRARARGRGRCSASCARGSSSPRSSTTKRASARLTRLVLTAVVVIASPSRC